MGGVKLCLYVTVYAKHGSYPYLSFCGGNYQRGLSETQNGYGFGMIPGHGPRDGYLSSLVFDGSPACKLFIAPDLGRYPSRGPCLMGRGVNPTFHSQMSTADQPLHQIT